MTKVAIQIMEMGSDPGYVPSSGYTEAIMVDQDLVADCGSDEAALWELEEEGVLITVGMLEDVQVSSYRIGVCNYRERSGVFELLPGEAVVQFTVEDVCTGNGIRRVAWIVNEDSLHGLYRELAV